MADAQSELQKQGSRSRLHETRARFVLMIISARQDFETEAYMYEQS